MRSGRPIIILTLGLVAILESEDELAFVLGHEAGHHIARHIPQQRQSAAEGARVFGEIVMAGGGSARDVAAPRNSGRRSGARTYSRTAELEADAIGTVIAARRVRSRCRRSAFPPPARSRHAVPVDPPAQCRSSFAS
jgi:predicted Zn-dependent protease